MNGQGFQGSALIPIVIVVIVMALRLRNSGRQRPLSLSTLWIVPAIYVLLVAFTVVALPPPPLGWTLLLLGATVGAVVGWYRARLIHIDVDPESGKLRQRASPLAMILLVGLVVLKLGARSIFGQTAAGQPGSAPMLLTDGFLGSALGLLSATRIEIYLRARRLLANA